MFDEDERVDEEAISLQIISSVGTARSCYIEAIHAARDGDCERAVQLVDDGRKAFLVGHEAHFKLIQTAVSMNDSAPSLILVHAEDQLMSAEAFGILAEEFISVYRAVSIRCPEM